MVMQMDRAEDKQCSHINDVVWFPEKTEKLNGALSSYQDYMANLR